MASLDLDKEIFVVHVTSITNSNPVHTSRQAQIALLKADKASIAILSKYTDFIDVFFPNLIVELP